MYRAQLTGGLAERYGGTVAVKTLKGENESIFLLTNQALVPISGFLSKEHVDNLLKECVKMQAFDHPNILKLIGVCLDGGPAPYIIVPFMSNGSLLSYLKDNRDSLVVDPNNSDHDKSDVVRLMPC